MSVTEVLTAAAAQHGDDFGFIDDYHYSVFDDPAQLVLGVLLYALPGVVLVIVAERVFPRVHFALRILVASILPFLFFSAVLTWSGSGISFLEGLTNLFWAIFSTELSAVVLPGVLIILGVGLIDRRRQVAKDKALR